MFSNHLKFAWDIDELIECEEFWPRLTQILSHNKDISRPVAVLLLADSIYQEGVEGGRARGRAKSPISSGVYGSSMLNFLHYLICMAVFSYSFYFAFTSFLLHIFPKNWKCALTFFLQKETPQVWLDEIWVDNWHALNWMKGESFSQAASFLLRLISPLFSVV